MSFTVGFVASDVAAVRLDADDAARLTDQLNARFDENRLGLPDLIGRLHDGAGEGRGVTVDERQAEELFIALGAAADDGGLSEGLELLLRAVERYLQAR